jgi:hypothetical protein
MSIAKEPCARCGQETAAGSAFYSDRRLVRARGGQQRIECSQCSERPRRSGKGLTKEQAEQVAKNGSMAMISISGHM